MENHRYLKSMVSKTVAGIQNSYTMRDPSSFRTSQKIDGLPVTCVLKN
jgi:hypothetical protein